MAFLSRSLLGVTVLALVGCKPCGGASRAPATERRSAPPATASSAEAARPDVPPQLPPPLSAPDDVAAPPATAERTRSGLASRVLRTGTGTAHPRAWDQVQVHYTGWTTDGRMFDSSVLRGEPAEFPLDRVIPGWTEGLQRMVVGEKRRLWIPAELAYRGQAGRPAGLLVFDVELLRIVPLERPPAVPADVGSVPASATCTSSGLCSRVLRAARGTVRPSAHARVTIEFSSFRPDGRLIDTTTTRGEPARISLERVIPGLAEGIALMVPGEKRRMWIPDSLGAGAVGGPGPGWVVYDVELLSIDAP